VTGPVPPSRVDIVAVLSGTADTAPPCSWWERAERAEAELAAYQAQRAQVRQQVRDGVAAGNFDLDVANHLLVALGLPPLPRYWTVNLQVAVTVEVTAYLEDDAFDAAQDLVDSVLGPSEIPDNLDVSPIGPATPGGLADELDTGPPA
jgi:hypothetical protein